MKNGSWALGQRWRSFARRGAFAVLLLFSRHALSTDLALHVATDHNPPLSYKTEEGEFAGLAVEILDLAAAYAGVSIVYEEMPWNRAFEIYSSRPSYCLLAIGRTPEREEKFLWVGPIVHGGIALFAMPGRELNIRDLHDVIAQDLTVGVARNDIAKSVLSISNGIKQLEIPSQTQGPPMLQHQRFDLWATGAISGRFRAASQGIAVREVLRVENIDVDLGCAPGTDMAPLHKLQSSINQLAKQGVIAKLERKYLHGNLTARP